MSKMMMTRQVLMTDRDGSVINAKIAKKSMGKHVSNPFQIVLNQLLLEEPGENENFTT